MNIKIITYPDSTINDVRINGRIKWFNSELTKRYKVGFISLNELWKDRPRFINGETLVYDYELDKLFIHGAVLSGLIYDKGNWATSYGDK